MLAERSLPAAASEIAKISSCAISDALDANGIWGVLPSSIRQLAGESLQVFGTAYTVQWRPARKGDDIRKATSTWDEVKDFLAPDVLDGKGHIYVAGAGNLVEEMALAGGLSATHFAQIGFEGIVLGGGIRDATVVQKLQIPIYATNFVARDTAGAYVVSEVGGSCLIGDVCVKTGDFVFADESGIIVIGAEHSRRVIEAAIRIASEENRILERIMQGETLADILLTEGHI